jgi:sulfatase maturation enzyme AslB (radical SAM superfamily)
MIPARNVVKFSRQLRDQWLDYRAGDISFAEFDTSVQGWMRKRDLRFNHVRCADTWGLRTHVLGRGLTYRPSEG